MAILNKAPLILAFLGLFWPNQVSAQCSQNTDCMAGGTCFIMSGCTKGTCACPTGKNVDYTAASPYACVTPTLTVETTCTKDADCFTNYCNSGTSKCDCSSGVASSDKKSCVNVALNGACTQTSNCGSMTSCTNNVCVCQTGLVAAANNVDCTYYFNGQVCNTTTSQCSIPNMGQVASWGSCSTGTCTCQNSSVVYTYTYGGQSANYCVPPSAQVNLPAGSKCTLSTNTPTANPLLLCGSNLACSICPENGAFLNATCVSPTPCVSMPCQNGGTCNAITGTTYTCMCPASYNGTNCETCTTCTTAALTTVKSAGSTILASAVFLLSVILLKLF